MNLSLLKSNFHPCPEIEQGIDSQMMRLTHPDVLTPDATIRILSNLWCLMSEFHEMKARGRTHPQSFSRYGSACNPRLIVLVIAGCIKEALKLDAAPLAPERQEPIGYLSAQSLLKITASLRDTSREAVFAKGELLSHITRHAHVNALYLSTETLKVFTAFFERYLRQDDPTGLALSDPLRETRLIEWSQKESI